MVDWSEPVEWRRGEERLVNKHKSYAESVRGKEARKTIAHKTFFPTLQDDNGRQLEATKMACCMIKDVGCNMKLLLCITIVLFGRYATQLPDLLHDYERWSQTGNTHIVLSIYTPRDLSMQRKCCSHKYGVIQIRSITKWSNTSNVRHQFLMVCLTFDWQQVTWWILTNRFDSVPFAMHSLEQHGHRRLLAWWHLIDYDCYRRTFCSSSSYGCKEMWCEWW